MDSEWFVYIIEAENGCLYTGITKDLAKRLGTHQAGKGAKFFRSSPPKRIALQKGGFDRSTALRLECQIKRLTRQEKIKLCLRGNFARFLRVWRQAQASK
jgi:putative endonuclease